MAVRNMTPVSSRRFTVHEGMLVAEASDLGDYLSQVYDDACDVGFAVRSERTGRMVSFAQNERKTDREGDVL